MTKSSIRCLNQEEKNTRKHAKDNPTPPTIIEEAHALHIKQYNHQTLKKHM